MAWEAIFCLVVLLGVLWGLLANRAPDALLLGAVVLFALVGIVTPQEALAGFSNPGMLTVAALFVIAAAMRETGALDAAGAWLLGGARTHRSVLARMAASLPLISAFLNNTPIVAMFIPIISSWCRTHRVAPSRLLLPLSYFCIIGGTCTLIGTSTNLVVNGLMTEASRNTPSLSESLRPMTFFEVGYVGLPYAAIGVAYMLLIGRRLLPNRKDLIEGLMDSPREYLVNMRVQPDCRLVGRTIEQAGLRHLPGLFLIEVVRDYRVISPVPPDCILRASDVLTFAGVVGTIVDIEKIPGLVPVADDSYEEQAAQRRHEVLCEAVVSQACPGIGKAIRDADFRATYNAAVIAVHRGGRRLVGRVGDIVLRPGDALLLQAGAHFVRAHRNNPDFLLVGGVEDSGPLRSEKALLSVVLLLVLVALLISGVLPTVVAVFLVAGLMIVFRCISASSARNSIDWQTLIAIAAAFGLAKALENSGIVHATADYLVDHTVGLGSYGLLAYIFFITAVFTAVITHTAAAALIFPFAVAIADEMGISPRPLVMAVVFAASASFVSPIGYQTNMMVYGPGGYKFGDFVRVGLPLTVLLGVCATLLIPLVWSF